MKKKAWMHGFLLVLVTFLSVFFYFYWMDKVKPWPDVDAMLSFYYPVKLWFANTGDFFADVKLFQELRPGYPIGLCFIFALFEMIGLGALVLEYPHIPMLLVFLGILSGVVWFFHEHHSRLLSLISLLVFPVTLILVRSQTPHTFTSLFAWLGCLLLYGYLKTENKKQLFLAGIFFFVSATIKHPGAVHGTTVLLSLLILFRGLEKPKNKYSVMVVFAALAIALLFYPFGMDYVRTSVNHNPVLSKMEVAINGVIYLILLIFSPWFFRKKSNQKISMERFFSANSFLILFCFDLCLCVLPRDAILDGGLASLIGLGAAIYILGFYWSRVYKNDADGWLGLMVLLSHAVATWFFVMRVGHIFHLFWLELALFICLSIKLNTRGWARVCVLFVVLSTLCPSYLQLQNIAGGFGHRWYQKIYNGTHVNLLGLRDNGFDEIRKKYRQLIWDFKEQSCNLKGVIVEADFYLVFIFREYLISNDSFYRTMFPAYETSEFDLSESSVEEPDFFLVGDSVLKESEKDNTSRADLNLSIDYKQKYLFERLKSSGVIESKYCKTDLSFDGRSLTLYRNNVLYDCTLITRKPASNYPISRR
jgi:hypothetical protein